MTPLGNSQIDRDFSCFILDKYCVFLCPSCEHQHRANIVQSTNYMTGHLAFQKREQFLSTCEKHADLFNQLCLARRPAIVLLSILCVKCFDTKHYFQTFQPNSFIPVMPVGPIDFYHFVSLSVTSALGGSHNFDTAKPVCFAFSLFSTELDKLYNEKVEQPDDTF